MAIVAGFDVDRAQMTFDALSRETGEVYAAGRMFWFRRKTFSGS
jgi:hypothetical protein